MDPVHLTDGAFHFRRLQRFRSCAADVRAIIPRRSGHWLARRSGAHRCRQRGNRGHFRCRPTNVRAVVPRHACFDAAGRRPASGDETFEAAYIAAGPRVRGLKSSAFRDSPRPIRQDRPTRLAGCYGPRRYRRRPAAVLVASCCPLILYTHLAG